MKNQKEVLPIIPPKDIVIGEASAKIKLVMFGDYESEASSKANDVMVELLKKFAGKINLVFRHFPLTRIHQKAHKAAEAAIGAAQEGKFWEMHQVLFRRKNNLGTISLKGYAREVGVTDKKFLDHLISSYYGWTVQDDLKEGLRLGVTDIPAIFINGKLFDKEPSLKNLTAYLDGLVDENELKVVKLKEKKRA
jgi:protein-disulfide isomerase